MAGGIRWTDETRRQRVFEFQNNVDITPTLPRQRIHSSNFAPELTLTYTPTDDFTAFVSYKKAYKIWFVQGRSSCRRRRGQRFR